MSYESSYDTGGGPFRPNKDRGLWSSSSDFLFACLANVIRIDCLYGIASLPMIFNGGLIFLLSCLVNMVLYCIPIIFIQSFLGQFSSSGLISVFRISPLFKGLGFIGLFVNLFSLSFYSVFAAVPLLFLFHSLQPVIPWSCEGAKSWLIAGENLFGISHCDLQNISIAEDEFYYMHIPSVEYFINLTQSYSFSLFGCMVLIWATIAFAVYNTTERIGQIFRYSTITMVSLLVIVFIRMVFLPGVREGMLDQIISPKRDKMPTELIIFMAPMMIVTTFGPGWGTVLSMASYNKFKTDISKYSVVICLSQMGILLMAGIVSLFTEIHLTNNNNFISTPIFDQQWFTFLSIPSSLAAIEWPHLWTWMFLLLLIIGSFNLLLVQLFTVLTALFDEFERLRPYRMEVIFGIVVGLAIISAFFCTENGILFIEVIADLNTFSQSLINLVLLVVVVWVYGRERFQRDVEFMTSQVLATWKVYMFGFVTPLFLITTFLIGFVLLASSHRNLGSGVHIGMLIGFVPWLLLPGYCIYKLIQTNGSINIRFKRCTKPTDWYPIDPEDRERYEETIDNPETSHPLTAIVL